MRSQHRHHLILPILLMLALLVTGCNSSKSSTTQAPTITTTMPATVVPLPTQNKGIYQFTGEKSTQNASLSFLAGASLNFYWSDLEPTKGQFNWSLVDQQMSVWTSHGKHVILRVSTAGNNMGGSSAQRTPQWVFDEGVPHVTLPSGAVYPQYWSATWLKELDGFLSAFAARYDGNPAITYIDVAVGNDGETIPIKDKLPVALPMMQSIGYTDQLWFSTIQKIIGLYTAHFHKTPLALQPDKTFIGRTPNYGESLVLQYAVQAGLWLQNDSLARGTVLNSIWTQHPLAVEQGHPAKQNGYPLQYDLQQAVNLHASYVLIFASDINDPANQSALAAAAAQLAG